MTNQLAKLPSHLSFKKPRQVRLETALHDIFPAQNIVTNARKEANIVSPHTRHFLELDFWLPDLNLAFEYQDPHHYVSTWYSYYAPDDFRERDGVKHEEMLERGHTLISIPCWWDGTNESLEATINFLRPDLFSLKNVFDPIPPNPPYNYFNVKLVPGVGELTLPSVTVTASFDPSSWWLSEKYDGVRACWNNSQKQLYSRTGQKISVPVSLAKKFPPTIVDGELWFGRGLFESALQFLSSQCLHIEMFRFLVFDFPRWASSVFELRQHRVLALIPVDHQFLSFVPQMLCVYKRHMKEMTFAILQDGGEGLVARKPNTAYQSGRTEEVLKFKAYRDQEAVVLEVDDEGCTLQLPNEATLRATIPSNIPTDSLHPNDVVTFVYAGFNHTTNLPNKAKVFRRRPDLTWQEVLDNHDLQTPHQRSPNDLTTKAFTEISHQETPMPFGHWTMDDNKNIRTFFDTLARNHNFDPKISENWYHVTRKHVLAQRGGSSIIAHYKGSYMHAIVDVYPELQLDERRFAVMPRYYWHNPKNRRNFLNSFAKSREFDPLIAENWYSITKDAILTEKSGRSFLLYFRGSLFSALSEVYPRVRFDEVMFERNFANFWQSEKNRRGFFDQFAKSNGFDPLVAANWHSISRSTILRTKSGGSVLNFYGGSMVKALLTLYPDIGLEKRQFATTRNFWQDPNHRRQFFDKLAEKKGFDPLIPDNWYSLSKEAIMNEKFGGAVIYHHDDNIAKALLDLYPAIGLKAHKFGYMTKNYWNNEKNRRSFFDALARKHNFDPLVPTNWYSFPLSYVTAEKSGPSVLYHHQGSLSKALRQLYPDIGLEDEKMRYGNSGSTAVWTEKENRREFFVSLAAKRGFDPLIADHWYSFRNEFVTSEPSGGTILNNYYGGSMVRALVDLFPDVQFQISKFDFAPKNYWLSKVNRKKFFDEFAQKNGFDPLDPLQWYQVSKKTISLEKNHAKVLSFYEGSFVHALLDLYPSIGLQEENFAYLIREIGVEAIRKRWVRDFASKYSFDPLTISNWLLFSDSDICSEKNGKSMLKYYNGNICDAIYDLFPRVSNPPK